MGCLLILVLVACLAERTSMGGKRVKALVKGQKPIGDVTDNGGSFGLDVSGDEAPGISASSWKCMVGIVAAVKDC
jgi:hypothetical protein